MPSDDRYSRAWETRRIRGNDRLVDSKAKRRAIGLCVECREPSAPFVLCEGCRKSRSVARRDNDKDSCRCGILKCVGSVLCRRCNDESHRSVARCSLCSAFFERTLASTKRFCSNRCRGVARRNEPRPFDWYDDLRSRLAFEDVLAARLATEGFTCQKSRASRGPFDIVAWTNRRLVVVQVKSTKDPTGRGAVNMCVDAAARLIAFNVPPWVEKWICVHIASRGWISYRIDEWTDDRSFLRARSKEYIRGTKQRSEGRILESSNEALA